MIVHLSSMWRLSRLDASTRSGLICGTRDDAPYRCFLPDLTGFEGARCTGPGPLKPIPLSRTQCRHLGKGFSPAYGGFQVQGTASTPLSTIVSILTLKLIFIKYTAWAGVSTCIFAGACVLEATCTRCSRMLVKVKL